MAAALPPGRASAGLARTVATRGEGRGAAAAAGHGSPGGRGRALAGRMVRASPPVASMTRLADSPCPIVDFILWFVAAVGVVLLAARLLG